MKQINISMILVLVCMTGQNLNAQFLEKLGKKVGDAVENTVINKTTKKAEKETGNAMDEVLEPGKSNKKNKSKSQSNSKNNSETNSNSSPKTSSPTSKSSYDFSYQYQLTMKTTKGSMVMDYFVQPKADYMGSKMSMSGMEQFMIFENNKIHTFMEMNGMKIAQSINSQNFTNELDVDVDKNDYKVSEIPGKTILGYKCKGMKMENDEYEFKIYYTNDAPFSLNNLGSSDQIIPEKFKNQVGDNSLMMEMQMVDKKKNKNNTTMECTLAAENKFTFSTQGYQSL